jgi:hypothetical protein
VRGSEHCVEDLGGAVLGRVIHDHHHALGAGDEIHRAAHALDHLAGDHPVREVALLGDLHRAQDREVDVAAADLGEADSALENTAEPGSIVTVSLPALIRSASSLPASG